MSIFLIVATNFQKRKWLTSRVHIRNLLNRVGTQKQHGSSKSKSLTILKKKKRVNH